jgi:ABC-type uncharacterized transport system permease subunit
MNRDFEIHFTGWSFIAATLMLWGGWMLLPVHINVYFKPENIVTIQDDLQLYIWMYRIHIFGMITAIASMAALGTVFPRIPSRVLVISGAAVVSTGMAALALGSAFFYQFGASGAYDLQGMSVEMIREFVDSLKLDTQYAGCFMRFGRVFTGLGLVILGAGLWKSKLFPSWLAIAAVLIGITAMAVIMAVPTDDSLYYPVFHLKALWLAAAGITVLRSKTFQPEDL